MNNNFKNITPAEFEEMVKEDPDAVVLDVRTKAEYDEGYIENASLIDIMQNDFPAKIEELDKTKNYYVYCKAGGRSVNACNFMAAKGFNGKLYNMMGGITAWSGHIKKD